MSGRPIIQIDQVWRRFGDVAALDGVSVDIKSGEFFSLLGPSGCGKTTLLRLIAGFDDPTEGKILIDGQPMMGVPANRRPTNMVFQSYAVFPHLTVAQNVAYGLRKQRISSSDRDRQVEESLKQVGLGGLGHRRSTELSGGQRQRVALARALIMRPKVLLLDEPLSALDKKLREHMQVELRQLQRQVGITFILVTHDQEEALTMSDRIAVMFGGKISQCDTPENIYQNPISSSVAKFIGGMNIIDASVVDQTEEAVTVDDAIFGKVTIKNPYHLRFDSDFAVGVRPERLTLLFDAGDTEERELQGEIRQAAYFGDMTYYDVALPGRDAPVTVSMRNAIGRPILSEGNPVRIGWAPESLVPLA